ncbi:MAG: hypothetical protein KF870_02170 [Leadbetterella sp.]|nr:hypothetical protein [Leadbetterella sp.]
MKSFFVVFFSLISFGVFANEGLAKKSQQMVSDELPLISNGEIISDEVIKKIQAHLSQENNPSSQIMVRECFIGSGSVSCAPPCSSGSINIATLPEESMGSALSQLLGISSSLCPGCNYSISSVGMNPSDCLEY